MSGICAIVGSDQAGGGAEILNGSTRGLSLDPSELQLYASVDEAGIAVSARFQTQQIYQDARILVACDTDLLNENELRESVRDGRLPEGGNTAALCGALYEQFGREFVGKLRGAFSVVLWDKRKRQLLAAVDAFGIHRLVYAQNGKTLLVASRAHALAASGMVDLAINPRSIANLLNFSVTLAPETIFAKVKRLSPGSLLVAAAGQVSVHQYWDMRYGIEGDRDEKRLAKALEGLFEKCVAEYCADGAFDRFGAFLSGGTDSSTVVGMMSRTGRGPVKAYSIGFEEQPFNELEYARIAAAKFQAEHHTYLVNAADCFEALPKMIRYFDEPFGNSSAIATYFCARLAAENRTDILLAGDGGDELFGGNERYATDHIYGLYHSVPRFLRAGIIEPVLRSVPVKNGLFGRARRYVHRACLPGIDRILCHQFLCTHDPSEIFEAGFLESMVDYSVLEVPRRHYDAAPALESLDRILYTDLKITLGDSDLPKVTCMAELAGMRVRFPFLDRAVAEFSCRLPARLKVNRFQKRYLFKKAFGTLLPQEILKKKKHGFGIPVSTWLKSDPKMRELAHDTLFSQACKERGYFRSAFVERLVREHEADNTSYYGDTLWTFLVLELWNRQLVNVPAGVAL